MQILSGNMKIQLHIFNASKQPQDENDGIGGVNCLHKRVENVDLQISSEDLLEECLADGGNDFDIHGHVENDNALLDSTPIMKQNMWQPKQEILTPILEFWKVLLFGI